MKFIKLHTKNTTIVYKNALCSTATVLVLVFIVLSVMIPILLVSLLSPYSGISESRVLYEQPTIKYKYQYIFVAEMLQKDEDLDAFHTASIVCSSFNNLNTQLKNAAQQCAAVKYWNEDTNNDGRVDFANFQLQLNALPTGSLLNFDLILFFEAELKHKCKLSPPALLTQRFTSHNMKSTQIVLKAELQLKQHNEFYCPFLGRNFQTQFRAPQLCSNDTDEAFDVQQYEMEAILEQVKRNSAYFQMHLQESYAKTVHSLQPLSIELQLQVLQVSARYHLSVWERLGQFWLYFASFFGISFYIMNKLKDFLFGRHIVRAWEVIPWKKLY